MALLSDWLLALSKIEQVFLDSRGRRENMRFLDAYLYLFKTDLLFCCLEFSDHLQIKDHSNKDEGYYPVYVCVNCVLWPSI